MKSCLSFDLLENNFSRTRTFGALLSRVDGAIRETKGLRSSETFSHSVVFREKHDLSLREGSDLSASAHLSYDRYLEQVLQLYYRVCDEFLEQSIFFPVIRRGYAEPLSYRECLRKWFKKIGNNGDDYGPWTVCIDLVDCYGTIDSKMFARLLDEQLGIDPSPYLELFVLLDRLGGGLVQGYLISDLIAAVALTTIDRYVKRHDLVMARYSDDCVFSCSSKEDCEKLVDDLRRFLGNVGFKLNETKLSIEGPGRLPWLRQGGRWGSFPVERYLKPPDPGKHFLYGAEASYHEGVDFSEQLHDAREAFEAMYSIYSKPPLKPKIESVHRHIIRGIAYNNPELIILEAKKLTAMRSSDIGLILKSKLTGIQKVKVVRACHPVRGGRGGEDAATTLLENVPTEYRDKVVAHVRKSIVREPSLRRAVLDTAVRDDQGIDLAFNLLERNGELSLSEVVCFQRLAVETGGRSARHLLQAVGARNHQFGNLLELVEQGVSDKIFS